MLCGSLRLAGGFAAFVASPPACKVCAHRKGGAGGEGVQASRGICGYLKQVCLPPKILGFPSPGLLICLCQANSVKRGDKLLGRGCQTQTKTCKGFAFAQAMARGRLSGNAGRLRQMANYFFRKAPFWGEDNSRLLVRT